MMNEEEWNRRNYDLTIKIGMKKIKIKQKLGIGKTITKQISGMKEIKIKWKLGIGRTIIKLIIRMVKTFTKLIIGMVETMILVFLMTIFFINIGLLNKLRHKNSIKVF